MIAELYPSVCGCNPIHEVRDWLKVRNLIRSARRGDAIPAILIDAKDGNMLTGTHRAAANHILRKLGQDEFFISVVTLAEIDADQDLQDAVDNLDYERIDELLDR